MANGRERTKEETMQRSHGWWVVILILAAVQLSGCVQKSDLQSQSKPAKVEAVTGKDLSKVTLSSKAAERLDIKTTPLRDEQVKLRRSAGAAESLAKPVAANAQGQPARAEPVPGTGTRKVVPTSAVLYDAKGKTWVYTNPEGLVFVRHAISIDYIDGDRAVLLDGPASGTSVVTVGAAELLGTEYGRK
jgi:hypothetical protein